MSRLVLSRFEKDILKVLENGDIWDVKDIINEVGKRELERNGKSSNDVKSYFELNEWIGCYFYNDMFLRFKSLINKGLVERVSRGKYCIKY